MCWRPVQAWPIRMSDRRQAARSRCSRRRCRNCRRWTASMPASKMAHGCRCGASSDLTEDQRERLRATPNADIVINLVRPTPAGDLPMRRIFQDRQGNEIDEIDLWNYGYDARKRSWYWQTMRSDRPYVSAPYLSFSIGAPVITVSAPLAGKSARRARRRSQARHLQRFRPGPAAGTAWHGHDLRPGGLAHRPSRFCSISLRAR